MRNSKSGFSAFYDSQRIDSTILLAFGGLDIIDIGMKSVSGVVLARAKRSSSVNIKNSAAEKRNINTYVLYKQI